MGAPDRPLLGAVPAVDNGPGAALKAARRDAGLTIDEFVTMLVSTRRARRISPTQHDSVRRQLLAFENGHRIPGEEWRAVLAETLQTSEDRLFGLTVAPELPRPLLADTDVTNATVRNLLRRREIYAEAEHIFGPVHVHQQVALDMQVVDDLVKTTPARLRHQMRLAAASLAELLGWLAQDSGNAEAAKRYTDEAISHLTILGGADPGLHAMLMMRRSNIITSLDPQTSIEFAEAAARLAASVPTGRLHASIARQQALAALAAGDERDFNEHLAYALDLAQAEPAPNELAMYATTAYVESEAATGLINLGRADEAAERLAAHIDRWPDGQQRDHAIARLRYVRALAVAGDYTAAIGQVEQAVRAWRATPSARAHGELKLIEQVLGQRPRDSSAVGLNRLRGLIKDALQGGSLDA